MTQASWTTPPAPCKACRVPPGREGAHLSLHVHPSPLGLLGRDRGCRGRLSVDSDPPLWKPPQAQFFGGWLSLTHAPHSHGFQMPGSWWSGWAAGDVRPGILPWVTAGCWGPRTLGLFTRRLEALRTRAVRQAVSLAPPSRSVSPPSLRLPAPLGLTLRLCRQAPGSCWGLQLFITCASFGSSRPCLPRDSGQTSFSCKSQRHTIGKGHLRHLT